MSDYRSFKDIARAEHYGRNGGKATALARKHSIPVEGGHYTYAYIAERMGYTPATAKRKVRACLRAKVKITWEALK